jgi:hypothetical protein
MSDSGSRFDGAFSRGTKLSEVPAEARGIPWTRFEDWVEYELTRQFRERYDAWVKAGKPLPTDNPHFAWASKTPATPRDGYGKW